MGDKTGNRKKTNTKGKKVTIKEPTPSAKSQGKQQEETEKVKRKKQLCDHSFCNDISDPANYPIGLPWASKNVKCLPGHSAGFERWKTREELAEERQKAQCERLAQGKYSERYAARIAPLCSNKGGDDEGKSHKKRHKSTTKFDRSTEESRDHVKFLFQLAFLAGDPMFDKEEIKSEGEEEDEEKEVEEASLKSKSKGSQKSVKTKSESRVTIKDDGETLKEAKSKETVKSKEGIKSQGQSKEEVKSQDKSKEEVKSKEKDKSKEEVKSKEKVDPQEAKPQEKSGKEEAQPSEQATSEEKPSETPNEETKPKETPKEETQPPLDVTAPTDNAQTAAAVDSTVEGNDEPLDKETTK